MSSLKDKIRLREYYLKNKKLVKQRVKDWCKNNPEKRKKIAKRWYLKNKESKKKYQIEWQKKNRDKVREYKRKSYNTNLEARENNLLSQRRHHNKSKFNGLREKRLNLDNYQCQMCGSKEKLHVHHKKYGMIRLEDLITLCSSCHQALHKDKERK